MAKPVFKYTIGGDYVCKYRNISTAARDLSLNESSIRRAITEDRTVLGKYKFSDVRKMVTTPQENTHKDSILILDIETAPMKGYIWNVWQQNIYPEQMISDFFILSWSAKWLGEPRIFSQVLSPEEVFAENDKEIMYNLWRLLDEAVIVITHNGKKFDIPKINSRLVVNGFIPPSPYKQIDTLQIARTEFGFTRNSLESLSAVFGLNGKIKVDFNLWKECMNGSSEHLNKLCEYNENDILVLEDVYLKLRPFAKNHPNLDMYVDSDKPTCPHCGSYNIELISNKYFYTQAVRYQVYRCGNCSAVSRTKKGIKFEHKKQVASIPR